MSDLIIDACSWHVDREAPEFKQRAFESFRNRYKVLLAFLVSEGLLIDPAIASNVDWKAFEFRRSHLTEEGFGLVKLCHGTWSPAFEQAHTQKHLVQWKRKLSALRSKPNNSFNAGALKRAG
jgi:hypothetical protein